MSEGHCQPATGSAAQHGGVRAHADTAAAQAQSFFAFDFGGCGKSQGDLISLGWHEKDDLQAALAHLRDTGHVTAVMLWGRSMGAVTAPGSLRVRLGA